MSQILCLFYEPGTDFNAPKRKKVKSFLPVTEHKNHDRMFELEVQLHVFILVAGDEYLLTPWSRVLLEKLTSKLCR